MRHLRLALFLILCASKPPVPVQHSPLVVVVNLSSSVSDLSIEELRGLFLGRTVMVDGKHRVALAEFDEARIRFYHSALSMDDDRFKRHWIKQVFAGTAAAPPETFTSVEDVKRFVAARTGGVAFLPASALDASVKAVTIEGHGPADPNYPLRD